MALRNILWLAFGALVACSTHDDLKSPRDEASSVGNGNGAQVATDGNGNGAQVATKGNANGAQGATNGTTKVKNAVLTPSNLPPDICDTPGTEDLTLNSTLVFDFDDTCDAVVPQAGGLPSICVRKFSTVSLVGDADVVFTGKMPLALVATDTFTLGERVFIWEGRNYPENMPVGGSDPRGEAPCAGGGGGNATAGGGSCGGPAIVPAPNTQLSPGSPGASADDGWTAGGYAGGALQFVSCGAMNLSGQIDLSGGQGQTAAGGTGPGGGSGGTLILEASQFNIGNLYVRAIGGDGGLGGFLYCGPNNQEGTPGLPGKGGTGAMLPGAGQPGNPGTCGPGGVSGSGGSVGRIVIDAPAGVSPPAIGASDPPPSYGTVATH